MKITPCIFSICPPTPCLQLERGDKKAQPTYEKITNKSKYMQPKYSTLHNKNETNPVRERADINTA
jgi:hypothetical protein